MDHTLSYKAAEDLEQQQMEITQKAVLQLSTALKEGC
jgi:hypothetical protein